MNTRMKLYAVIAAVIVVIIVVAYAYFSSTSGQNLAAYDNVEVNISTYLALQSIATNTTLASQIGLGADSNPPKAINGSPLLINGTPTVLYVGAEYCPYCAAGRWGLLIALLRFGEFSQIHYMTSSTTDVFGGTPTFTFYNSTYSSKYLKFVSTETETNTDQPLQALTGVSSAAFSAYDVSGIPFMDFGNKSIQDGAPYSPNLIWKMNWQQIISQLNNPNSSVAQSIIGSANYFTAQICMIDNYSPASVCSAKYVSTILRQQ